MEKLPHTRTHYYIRYIRKGRLTEAVELLDRLKRRGLKPDRFTFTTLLLAAGRSASQSHKDGAANAIRGTMGAVEGEKRLGKQENSGMRWTSEAEEPEEGAVESTASERSSAAVSSIMQQMKLSGVVADEIAFGAYERVRMPSGPRMRGPCIL